ncbi:MAG: AEC family transporter [Oscillospiraceae bacterium]|nr:AEC family transporter [Oscillospiraceae bacterium]
MQIALLILKQMIKFFLMLMMGYAIVKKGILKSTDSKVLSSIAVYLVTPCVIINAFQIDYTAEAVQGLLLALGVAVCIQMIFLTLISTVGKKLPAVERASIMYSNAANMIIPIIQAVLGQEWVLYTSAYIAVQIVMMWTHCRSMLCGDKGIDWKKILTNLNIISIIIGVALFLAGIHLPAVVTDTFSSLGSLMAPLGMIVLGMLMADADLKKIFLNPQIYKIAATRLLICPLLMLTLIKVTGAYHFLPEAPTILFVSFLATCTPPAVNITQMAQIYGKDAQYSSSINVVSICLCLITIPIMAGLYWLVIS